MDNNHQPALGVLWDMDGVLVDTGDLHFQSPLRSHPWVAF
jgi:phosphoglycolate phosphatase-like HAD superfamily hydrolase